MSSSSEVIQPPNELYLPSSSSSDAYGGQPLKRDSCYIPEKEKYSPSPIRKTGRMPSSRGRKPILDPTRWTCVISHVGLILTLILLTIKKPGPGEKFLGTVIFDQPSFPISGFGNNTDFGQALQSGTKLGFGWIVTGWTIILTLTTQKLALRRQLTLYNNLTAKHDANESWMGLGAAIMGSLKFRQLGFRTSLNSIFLPLAYLAGIASFHSTAGSMFTLSQKPFNKALTFSSQGIPDFTGAAIGNASSTGADALMTMLSLKTLIFPGLAPDPSVGVIYDTPNPNSSVSTLPYGTLVEVNATYFNVTCGSLAGSVQQSGGVPAFVFPSELGLGNTTVPQFPNTISQHSLVVRPAPWGLEVDSEDPKSLWPSSILIFTTVPVSDSSNNVVESVPVTPPMTYISSTGLTSSTSLITALACNLTVDISSNKASVDPQTNFLLNISGQVKKSSAQVSPFPVEYRSTPIDLAQSPGDALQALWSPLTVTAVSPLENQLVDACTTKGNSDAVCGELFQPEQFVMETLNIFPDLLLEQTSVSIIDLADLENVLSRMTAIEFWAEGQETGLKFDGTGNTGASTNTEFVTNTNIVQVEDFSLVFAIDRLQLFGALAIAIVLFALAARSVLDNNDLKIDHIGILQMIWLAHDHPEIDKQINDLSESEASEAELRQRGLNITRIFGDTKSSPREPC